MTLSEYENSFSNKSSLQYQVFQILKDKEWHCRKCDYSGVDSGQLAGGGGIQGLQRGNKSRPGIVIESRTMLCPRCNTSGRFDRWTGAFQNSSPASGIPKALQDRILDYYGYEDVIEQRRRQSHELVIDHRFAMERWGESEEANPSDMDAAEIQRKFQLLKKDGSGNHNLLKSRACERCLATGKRQYPLGIKFFYAGDENWPVGVPATGPRAEAGCVGCGWYDFEEWRRALNRELGRTSD
nr:MAG TPA: ICEA Protein [Caudoviricetes sp.]